MGALDVAKMKRKLYCNLAITTKSLHLSLNFHGSMKLRLITYALLLIVDIAADVLVGLIVEELMLSLANEHQEIVHRKTFEVSKIVKEFLVDTYQTWWAA